MEKQIVPIEKIVADGVAAFEGTRSKVTALAEQYRGLSVTDINDNKQLKKVSDARKELKRERCAIEKQGVEIRRTIKEVTDKVTEKEKELVAIISPVEDQLEAEEKRVEAERERIRKEEAKRLEEKVKARMKAITDAGAVFDGIGYKVGTFSMSHLELLKTTDEDFEELVEMAKTSAERERERIREEQEAAEQERQRAEAARKEEEERQRKEIEAEKERLRAAAEGLERAKKEQEERERKIREEEQRIAAERERIEREKREEEQRKLEAQAAIEAEERWKLQQEEDERQRKLEEDRLKEQRDAMQAEIDANNAWMAFQDLDEPRYFHCLEMLLEDHGNWSADTFPIGSPIGALLHAARELEEVKAELARPEFLMNKHKTATEFADLIFCVMDSARRAGITVADIVTAGRQKLEINKKRQWRYNGDGSYSHVKSDEIVAG